MVISIHFDPRILSWLLCDASSGGWVDVVAGSPLHKTLILVIFSIVQFQWPQRHARYRVGKLIWSRICFDHKTSNLELFDSSSVGGEAAAGS